MFFLGATLPVVFRTAAGFAAGTAAGVLEPDAPTSGDFGRSVPLPFALGLRNGDPTRGVPVREGGFEGRLIEGLSHEEKKSSSSAAGVLAPSLPVASGPSVMTTSSGKLHQCQQG